MLKLQYSFTTVSNLGTTNFELTIQNTFLL